MFFLRFISDNAIKLKPLSLSMLKDKTRTNVKDYTLHTLHYTLQTLLFTECFCLEGLALY